jgi:polyphenol oxidase
MEPVIKSGLLAKYPEIIHGVSTKSDGSPPYYNNMSKYAGDEIENVMLNRTAFFKSIGINTETARFVHANQVHSAKAAVVTHGGLVKETDALITNSNELYLVISVADCLPVMLYDNSKRVIANIHSGWRGASKKIVSRTIEKMKKEFGTNAVDLTAFIGPGISCDNFEVGADVAELFDKKYVQPFGSSEKKFSVDLKKAVFDELLDTGVKQENIDVCGYCSYAEKDYLHSYRRDRDKSGRMFAVIGLANKKNPSVK